MQITNISDGKIIGIGKVNVLPGETKEVPTEYETNPVISFYERSGFARLSGKKKKVEEAPIIKPDEKKAAEEAKENAEALRKARLASLKGISDENLAKLALDLGIGAEQCKDTADMLAKVKAALEK